MCGLISIPRRCYDMQKYTTISAWFAMPRDVSCRCADNEALGDEPGVCVSGKYE